MQFAEDARKKASQGEIQENRQKGVRVIVEINVLAGPQTVMFEDIKADKAHEHRCGHVNIQEGVFPERATLKRRHHHGRF
jgi:hypothetical protein